MKYQCRCGSIRFKNMSSGWFDRKLMYVFDMGDCLFNAAGDHLWHTQDVRGGGGMMDLADDLLCSLVLALKVAQNLFCQIRSQVGKNNP